MNSLNNKGINSAAYKRFKGIPGILQQLAALFILIILSPLLLLTFLIIRLESHGPVIFTQIRVGLMGERFKLYKFRSMYMQDDPRYKMPKESDSNRDGVCKKYFHDPRITRAGKIIRKLSIDELPQLFNVLKGEMMLIGPRPALPIEVNDYNLENYRRLDAKPGLTGLWQVSGRANTSFEQQLDLDITYVNTQSIFLDFKILLATIPAVLTGEGAY
jgi:lipopolysaccharide/colanic/teichoic acid biosynthesis glycosyltransferase